MPIFYRYDENGNYIGEIESDVRQSFTTPYKPLEGQIFNRVTQQWEYPRQPSIEERKHMLKEQIKARFEEEFRTGKLVTSYGFTVDNRRWGKDNDKDNLQSLMALEQYPIYFKDADGVIRELTKEMVETIINEMVLQGLQRYQKKWQKEQELAAITTEEELAAFKVWDD